MISKLLFQDFAPFLTFVQIVFCRVMNEMIAEKAKACVTYICSGQNFSKWINIILDGVLGFTT